MKQEIQRHHRLSRHNCRGWFPAAWLTLLSAFSVDADRTRKAGLAHGLVEVAAAVVVVVE